MQPARSRILFVCLLQSLALVLLLVGARHGWLPLYLALPLGVVLLWLPWLLPGNRTAVATVGEPDIARLARDLSHNTSQNALSAAGVAFSVKRLAEKLQSQLDAAEQIVGSAEVMIHTERATSNLARQAMDAATRARAGSDEGQVLLASTIERMHRPGQGLVLASSILVSESVASGLLQPYRADISVDGAGYSALCVPGRERHPPVKAFFEWLRLEARQSGHACRLERDA